MISSVKDVTNDSHIPLDGERNLLYMAASRAYI